MRGRPEAGKPCGSGGDQKTASTGLVEDKEEQNVYAALALLVDEKEMDD